MIIIETKENERGKVTVGKIDHLSASTVMSMKTCGRQVYFRKIKGIPNKTQYSKTIFGLAIHHALEVWGRAKIEEKPIKLGDVIKEFHKYFDEHYKEITVWGTDTYEQLSLQGEIALDLFFKKFGKKLEPAQVECGFVINRGDGKLPVVGFQDLITKDDCIYDYKLGKRATPSKYIGNMSIYAWDYLRKTGAFPKEVATLSVKWRTCQKQDYVAGWEKHIIPVDMKYIKYIEEELDDTEKMINAGIFPRAESGCGLCKNCGYKEMCGTIVLEKE